jgi:hypothetical protein
MVLVRREWHGVMDGLLLLLLVAYVSGEVGGLLMLIMLIQDLGGVVVVLLAAGSTLSFIILGTWVASIYARCQWVPTVHAWCIISGDTRCSFTYYIGR